MFVRSGFGVPGAEDELFPACERPSPLPLARRGKIGPTGSWPWLLLVWGDRTKRGCVRVQLEWNDGRMITLSLHHNFVKGVRKDLGGRREV